jgi:UDP-N-acetylglucosamine--N-acetylmuramyl-(pentapeptide) pyrophosphoryl-undecaprenol N-acetylglucosamine transferase
MTKFLIAASGTGGHLLPALTIAESLKEQTPSAEIIFIGSGRPLEAEIIDSRGYRREIINIVGLKRRGLTGFLSFLRLLPKAILKTNKIISKEKPNVVIGVGGYVSTLPVLLASFRRIPTLIHEAEEKPGWSNYVLSYFAKCVTTAHTAEHFPPIAKVVSVGTPLNPEIAKADFKSSLPEKPTNILILGGSQGAEAIDNLSDKLAQFLREKNFKVVHQARKDNIAKVTKSYEVSKVTAEVVSFISAMKDRYNWAHIIISRAGAATVKEIEFSLRPAILIPLPKAEEQLMNAERVARNRAIYVITEDDKLAEKLINTLKNITDSETYRNLVAKNLALPSAAPEAARKIALAVLELIK